MSARRFGFDAEEVTAAIDSVVLPPEAGGQPEGWLAPGTYPEMVTASELVQAMVDRRIAQLEGGRADPRGWAERLL